jgi:hypothetical protein
MSEDTTTELAKAAQEVSKTARAAIEVADKSRAFLYKVIGQPLEDVVQSLIGEPLHLFAMRKSIERRIRFIDRYNQLIQMRHLEGRLVPVPLKVALPAIESATLETDDSLQDLWVNLLMSAGDPTQQSNSRTGFVDILKQMEPLDAKILSLAYRELLTIAAAQAKGQSSAKGKDGSVSPIYFGIEGVRIIDQAAVTQRDYQRSIDNLIRVRCVATFVVTEDLTGAVSGTPALFSSSADYLYDRICITSLGLGFVEACIDPTGERFEGFGLARPAASTARPLPNERKTNAGK